MRVRIFAPLAVVSLIAVINIISGTAFLQAWLGLVGLIAITTFATWFAYCNQLAKHRYIEAARRPGSIFNFLESNPPLPARPMLSIDRPSTN
jgi:hypothetical protein